MARILKSETPDYSEITIDFKKRSVLDFKQITNYDHNLKEAEKRLKKTNKKPFFLSDPLLSYSMNNFFGGILHERINFKSLKESPFYNQSKREFLIPYFQNEYLRWNLDGDMKKQLTSIKVRCKEIKLKSGYLRTILFKVIAKLEKRGHEEIILLQDKPYWYVVFQFEKTPRNGNMILEYI